jgi:hypothetical protein
MTQGILKQLEKVEFNLDEEYFSWDIKTKTLLLIYTPRELHYCGTYDASRLNLS